MSERSAVSTPSPVVNLLPTLDYLHDAAPVQHARRLFVEPYAQTFLPRWSLWATGVTVPVVELVAGALLLIGWHSRAALLLFLLVMPQREDRLSFDVWLATRRGGG